MGYLTLSGMVKIEKDNGEPWTQAFKPLEDHHIRNKQVYQTLKLQLYAYIQLENILNNGLFFYLFYLRTHRDP